MLGDDRNAIAAISVASPVFRLSVDDLIDLAPTLTEAARRLAVLLPYRAA